jgi:amino acid transporter
MYSTMKRILIGPPIASTEEHHQRLIKLIALAVFASDAISSTAYATEEILIVLVPAGGMEAFEALIPIAVIVVILLAIVVTSYRQTIYAYPGGGGSYVVSRENLGTLPSLVAGSSLLVDYVLTVAVSVSAGVAAITSAFEGLAPYRVELCVLAIALLTLGNLRGLKESGKIFAGPTYLYVLSMIALIVYGLYRSYTGDLEPLPPDTDYLNHVFGGEAGQTLGLFVLLRAFSSGAVALSGVEAISDGVPAFRKPESRNAARTLIAMAVILGSLFFGLSLLTHRLRPIVDPEEQTLLSALGSAVWGDGTFLYYVLQFSTFAILILAANTAYADFPRLCSFVARDGFLPRQLANRGDRLVFSNGVLVLSGMAAVLIVIFGGETQALIPLYAVGVFTGFTLSQSGMVVYQWRNRGPRWKVAMTISAIGAAATGIVLIVVVVSKFAIGAWLPAVVIPALVTLLLSIRRHYDRVRAATAAPPDWRPRRYTHTVVVLVGALHKGTLNGLQYARSLAPDRLIAISIVGDADEQRAIERQWDERDIQVELHTIYSPYRDLTGPVLAFLDELDAEDPDDLITVVIPEFVVTSWYTQVLHNQTALALKARLLFRPNTVVTSVPVLVE